MKKTKFTEEQILFALKRGNAGQPVADVCRQMGISEATYYVWKKRYADLGILEVRELRQLRDENARLKRLVADLTLDRYKKKDLASPSPRRRDIARWIRDCFQLNIRRACGLSCLRNATWYYRSQSRDSEALRQRLGEMAAGRAQERPSSVQARGTPDAYESPSQETHQPAPGAGADRDHGGSYWALDCVHDQLAKGRKFRVLTVIDKWHRQCVACSRIIA